MPIRTMREGVAARATHAVACCICSLAIHSWYRGTCHRRYGRRTIRSVASVVASFNRIGSVESSRVWLGGKTRLDA